MNPFVHLNKQFLAGEWRDGSTTRTLTDRNPYNDKPICELELASRADLDQAYRAAAMGARELTTLKWISVQHTRRHFPFEPS